MQTGKAWSVLKSGEADNWSVSPGFAAQMSPQGMGRLVVTVPFEDLPRVHAALVGALSAPLGVLYRRKVDRLDPKPQGWPGQDFVGLDLPADTVLEVLSVVEPLINDDARGELWIRGRMQEQLVLDQDGTMYCYPDDPSFRDALAAVGLTEQVDLKTLEDRDYVRHWFHGEHDEAEATLIERLQLTEVRPQR